jgi:hypothetical protein
VHIGYYYTGFLFYKIFDIFNFSIDATLILMSNILGAVGVVFGYLLLEKLLDDRKSAFLGSILLLFSGTYVYYARSAEVYVPQVAFILASMYYYHIRKFVLSGILFAIAMLITPLSIFISPFFIFFHFKRRSSFKDLLYFVIPFCAIYLPVFASVYEELLWGRRGLLKIGLKTPYIPLTQSVYIFIYGSIKSFNVLAPFALIGYVYFSIKDKNKFLLITLMLLSQLYLIVKIPQASALERFLLPIYIFLCLLILEGLYCILRKVIRNDLIKRGCLFMALITYISLNLFIWVGPAKLLNPRLLSDNKYKEAFIAFNKDMEKDALLIASFWDGVAFAYYTRNDIKEELETTMGNKRWINAEYLYEETFQQLLSTGKQIYVMESYAPSTAGAIFLSQEELEKRYREFSMKSQIESMADNIGLEEYFSTDGVLIYKLIADAPGRT